MSRSRRTEYKAGTTPTTAGSCRLLPPRLPGSRRKPTGKKRVEGARGREAFPHHAVIPGGQVGEEARGIANRDRHVAGSQRDRGEDASDRVSPWTVLCFFLPRRAFPGFAAHQLRCVFFLLLQQRPRERKAASNGKRGRGEGEEWRERDGASRAPVQAGRAAGWLEGRVQDRPPTAVAHLTGPPWHELPPCRSPDG